MLMKDKIQGISLAFCMLFYCPVAVAKERFACIIRKNPVDIEFCRTDHKVDVGNAFVCAALFEFLRITDCQVARSVFIKQRV